MDTTVVKALTVLEALAASTTPLGVTELAMKLGLSKSNVHRLLQTLASRGYVTQIDQRYTVTTRLWELGAMIISRLDVAQDRDAGDAASRGRGRRDGASPILDMAACEVVSIHNVESTQPVRAYSRIGQRTPAHCVATGKALLSVQAPEALRALPEELPRFTPHTLYSARRSSDGAGEDPARRGYSTNAGEWREQVGGAAAAIFDHAGRPVAPRPDRCRSNAPRPR